jgi:hypothetical protein
VDVVIDARDPDGIREVVFWAEDKIVGKRTSPPYNFVFDSRPHSGESGFRLKAVAFDKKGNKMRKVTRVSVR